MALTRREFLARAGWAGMGAALIQLPAVLRGKGWLDEAAAQGTDLTHDTISGLIAFVVPGPDRYSVAQGESSRTPGGIQARGADNMIQSLDQFVPPPALGPLRDGTVPASAAVAALLNAMAAQVDPVANAGGFPSPFARLSFDDKVEVFRRLETWPGDDDLAHTIRYVAGALPIFAALCSYDDWHRFDPRTRKLTARPVGWDLANYYPGRTSAADGWPEFRGYYKGRKKAER